MLGLADARVAVYQQQHPVYPEAAPFHPSERYPESPFAEVGARNETYAAVRQLFIALGFDAQHQGTAQWNPLGALIMPGDTVVLKPNFVRDFPDPGGHWMSLNTAAPLIRAVLDYVAIALRGSGSVTIADAPMNDTNFDEVVRKTKLDSVVAYLASQGFAVGLVDIRPERVEKREGIVVRTITLPGDPNGYARVDLGTASAFYDLPPGHGAFYGADYDMEETNQRHRGNTHEYLISGTVLKADVVINLPKYKTHKKTGVTLSLKNLVGINGNKNWLPHHREGTPAQGGDQFAASGIKQRLEHWLIGQFKRRVRRGPVGDRPVAVALKRAGTLVFGDTNKGTIRSGNWYGNDTTWRMVHDLNRALLYADACGVLRDQPQRRYLSILDGVVAGEGNGPMASTDKPTGIVAAATNALALDLACARLMGFDYLRIPQLHQALRSHRYPLCQYTYADVRILSNVHQWHGWLEGIEGRCLDFVPHFGWQGHVEVASPDRRRVAG